MILGILFLAMTIAVTVGFWRIVRRQRRQQRTVSNAPGITSSECEIFALELMFCGDDATGYDVIGALKREQR